MITYGIDPAARSLGIVGWTDAGVTATKLTTPKGNRDAELKDLRYQLIELLGQRSRVIFLEQAVVAGRRNLQTTIRIAETVGMVLTMPGAVYTVAVSDWKKATVGKGNATKEDVSSWLSSEHPDYAAICEGDQDLIDAGAINVYGREIMGSLGQFRLQRA